MLNRTPPAFESVHRNLCTAGKRNGASHFGAGSLEKDFWEDYKEAKIDLTYSTASDISRVKYTLGALLVCIIQVDIEVPELPSMAASAVNVSYGRWLGPESFDA